MSIEKQAKRNLRQNSERFESSRILSPSEKQRALTDKWILPYQNALITDVESIRRGVDKDLQKDPEIKAGIKLWNKRYPDGLCGEIRNMVLARMFTDAFDRSNPGLTALKDFVREGGIVKDFWGIDNGKYFQNAIQIGNSILDVANDTVDRTKSPIVFYPSIDIAPLKNIENFTEFADIAESYWKSDIYPNIYIPELAPVFPAISIRQPKTSSMRPGLFLETQTINLAVTNASTVRGNHLFGLSSDFLFNSPYSDKRLPDDMVTDLFNSDSIKILQKWRPDGRYEVSTDPEKAKAVIESFHFDEGMQDVPLEYSEQLLKLMRAGEPLEHIDLLRIEKGE